jgi:hypothetical protein
MPDAKHAFEAQTLKIKTVQPHPKVKGESGQIKKESNQLGNQPFSFSRDVILRLIDWFEKE